MQPNQHNAPGTQANVIMNSGNAVSETRNTIIAELVNKGYRINDKRMAFVTALCLLGTVSNPEEFWIYLKERNVCISITSVYNILRILVRENLIIKNRFENGCNYVVVYADN